MNRDSGLEPRETETLLQSRSTPVNGAQLYFRFGHINLKIYLMIMIEFKEFKFPLNQIVAAADTDSWVMWITLIVTVLGKIGDLHKNNNSYNI